MTAAIVRFQKKEEAKFICSACGADRGCQCNATAIEKLAQKQEQDRKRAKAYRERKFEENQQSRHVTELGPDMETVAIPDDPFDERIGLDGKTRKLQVRETAPDEDEDVSFKAAISAGKASVIDADHGPEVADPAVVKEYCLDCVNQHLAVARAFRKIFKLSSFDAEAGQEIGEAINRLVAKWRLTLATLTRSTAAEEDHPPQRDDDAALFSDQVQR